MERWRARMYVCFCVCVHARAIEEGRGRARSICAKTVVAETLTGLSQEEVGIGKEKRRVAVENDMWEKGRGGGPRGSDDARAGQGSELRYDERIYIGGAGLSQHLWRGGSELKV